MDRRWRSRLTRPLALCVGALGGSCFAGTQLLQQRSGSLVDGALNSGLSHSELRRRRPGRRSRIPVAGEDQSGGEIQTLEGQKKAASSKTQMLRFALPALGIYLANPIMSNIDNSFVGHFAGTTALAALSPGGVLADNLFFLFNSVLSAATTGLVARAWPKGVKNAREELTRTFTFALAVGVPLTMFYFFCSNWALGLMGVAPDVREMAASYARIRGLVAWASLAQGVCLSAILATRDAVTPLKVVCTAAALNCLGDFLFCCWPLQTGVSGAAAATALSTMAGFALMLRSLKRKQILPSVEVEALRDAGPVLEYAGPMMIINTTRIMGYTAMAFAAAALGTQELAAYQVILGIFVLFAFVGAPLSQTAQSMLPPLIEANDTQGSRKVSGNVLTIATAVSLVAGCLCFAALRFGAQTFTADVAVLGQVHSTAFMVFLTTVALLLSSSIDGALLAAKDFRFIVFQQGLVVAIQLFLLWMTLKMHMGLPAVWMTLAVRVMVFIPGALTWVCTGNGPLGRVMFPKGKTKG